MNHVALPEFWKLYRKLPSEVQATADKNYILLRSDSRHPSLHFKKIGQFWSVRVGLDWRALAFEEDGNMVWFWIGSHAEYNHLIK